MSNVVLKINTAYYHSCWLHPVVSGDGITKQIVSEKLTSKVHIYIAGATVME